MSSPFQPMKSLFRFIKPQSFSVLPSCSLHTSPALLIRTTQLLNAQPMKKKKKVDPAVLAAKEAKKIKRLDKEIKRLSRFGRILKPVAEIDSINTKVLGAKERARSLPALTFEESERRAGLQKAWSKHKAGSWFEEYKQAARLAAAQEEALTELRAESEDLYQQAIQLDYSFVPLSFEGPKESPPIKGFKPVDGEYVDITRKPFHLSDMTNKSKGQASSSNKWLERKYRDIFTKQAGRENYRCRSAYKLIQINEKFNLLHPGGLVIDCGSSPGSWCQVAAQNVNAANSDLNRPCGVVIGIDLKHVVPVEGATILGGHDFTTELTQQKVRDILQERKADIILSDMAPAATGNKAHNHDNIVQLCFSVLRFSLKSLQPGGATVVKLWSGPGQTRLSKAMDTMFDQVTPFKPKASYDDSAELFLVGIGFKLK